jgi:NADPH:quinone reductase-like Zn-dependent oxidoreductase
MAMSSRHVSIMRRVARQVRGGENLVKAVQATKFGDPTVLKVVDLPDPVPGPGEIAIDVTHAAVGLIDVFLRQGCRFPKRPPRTSGWRAATSTAASC